MMMMVNTEALHYLIARLLVSVCVFLMRVVCLAVCWPACELTLSISLHLTFLAGCRSLPHPTAANGFPWRGRRACRPLFPLSPCLLLDCCRSDSCSGALSILKQQTLVRISGRAYGRVPS